jgi:hypothetical protein
MLKPLDVHWYSVANNSVAPLLQLDRFTMGYLVVAVLVMLLSHPLAWRDGGGRWTWRLGCLLAAPTMALFAVAVVALAWALVLGAIALAAGLLGLLINGEFEFVTLEYVARHVGRLGYLRRLLLRLPSSRIRPWIHP